MDKDFIQWYSLDVWPLSLLTLVQPVYVIRAGLSCGVCGARLLEFPSQRLLSAPLWRERVGQKEDVHRPWNVWRQKASVWNGPKQRERSAPQSNFILQMMGFVKAETRAKCLECHCRPDKPNQQSHAVVCAHWHFELDILFFTEFTVCLIYRLYISCYYKDEVSFKVAKYNISTKGHFLLKM